LSKVSTHVGVWSIPNCGFRNLCKQGDINTVSRKISYRGENKFNRVATVLLSSRNEVTVVPRVGRIVW